MASPINGDYPVLMFDDAVCQGSKDGIFIDYAYDLNTMITAYNNANGGGSIYLYDVPSNVTVANGSNVKIYVNENIGFLQSVTLQNVRTGVTLDNSSSGFMAYDWHMFSSALTAAPMGLEYHSEDASYYVYANYSSLAANGIPHANYGQTSLMDPPKTTWSTSSIGYFPTDAPYGTWRGTADPDGSFDFYCFHEPSRHWINFKREGRTGFYDHWNQYVYNPTTDNHANIAYPNESEMVAGKGYMVALSEPSMLMADGVLNNSATQTFDATFNASSGYDYPLRGLNLVGNPFQSYLDFNDFAGNTTNQAAGVDTYYILDADAHGYISYTVGQSTPEPELWPDGLVGYSADRYLHPHQGFLVSVDDAATLQFTSGAHIYGFILYPEGCAAGASPPASGASLLPDGAGMRRRTQRLRHRRA